MYTLTPIGGTPILANLDLGYYDLLDTAETYLNIDFDFRRGEQDMITLLVGM
ncbi:MAG: hypothetical protein CM15mV13_1250 [uncultured marine virus]|nr:MAG: hypothetical protein CM15mV13_1250 [uncultured marine virus]